MVYGIYLGAATQGINTEKDGDIYVNGMGVWVATYWNIKGDGFIEHKSSTFERLKERMGKHAAENGYYFITKPIR